MSVGDISRRVITSYEAITDDHERALERLKGKTQESHKSFLEWGKGLNEAINSSMESLGKFNQAFEGVTKIVEFGRDGIKAYGEDLRLQAAAGAVNIEKLSEAAHGLRTEHDLLTFAAKTSHGVLGLNQQQMETAQEAMVALTRAGFDQVDVQEKLTMGLIDLKTKGWDKLGIAVKQGATDHETLKNMMDALNATIEKNKSLASSEAEDVQRLSVKWDNAKDAVDRYVGETLSLRAFKEGKGGLFDISNVLSFGHLAHEQDNQNIRAMKAADLGSFLDQSELDRAERGGRAPGNDGDPFALVSQVWGAGAGLLNDPWRHSQDALEAWMVNAQKKYETAKQMAERLAEERRKLAGTVAKSVTDDLVAQLEGEESAALSKSTSAMISGSMGKAGAGMESLTASFNAMQAKMNADSYNRFAGAKSRDFLKDTFGDVGKLNMYKLGFDSITESLGTMYDAAISGSEPAGQAFKKMLGVQVAGSGKQMMVEGIKEGAWALGRLAIGDFAGAAQHGAAALEFEAGAALAGVVASELGYGSGSGSASSGGGRGSGGGGGGGGWGQGNTGSHGAVDNSPKTTVIILGDPMNGNSPRMQQRYTERIVKLGNGRTSSGYRG